MVDEAVAALLPIAFCLKRGAAPIGFAGAVLRIAVTNPSDYSVLQDAGFRTGKKVVAVVVTQTLVEVLGMIAYVRLIPRLVPAAPSVHR